MKSLLHKVVLTLICTLPLAGCGGGGAPGSFDAKETDVVIKSASLVITSPDLDAAIHMCSATEPEKGLFRDSADLTVDATVLDPTLTSYDPFPVSVEACTITYLKANENPAAPIIEDLTIYPNMVLVNGVSKQSVTIIDIQRKNDFWSAITSGTNRTVEMPTHYIARYRCTYVTRYGKSGTFQTELDIWLADFETC